MGNFLIFDEICEVHNVTRGDCLVQHLRVPPEQAIAMLKGRIEEGEAIGRAILDELNADEVATDSTEVVQ